MWLEGVSKTIKNVSQNWQNHGQDSNWVPTAYKPPCLEIVPYLPRHKMTLHIGQPPSQSSIFRTSIQKMFTFVQDYKVSLHFSDNEEKKLSYIQINIVLCSHSTMNSTKYSSSSEANSHLEDEKIPHLS